LICLCGTPATGKTIVAGSLAVRGFDVFSLNDLVEESGLHEGMDVGSGSLLVDVDLLRDHLESWAPTCPPRAVLEGHLSYLAPADLCIVLRADPALIKKRLLERGYPDDKAFQNAEAEGVGVLTSWAFEEERRRTAGLEWEDLPRGCGIVLERDVTRMDVDSITEWVLLMVSAFEGKDLNTLVPYRPGNVDWLEVLAGWF